MHGWLVIIVILLVAAGCVKPTAVEPATLPSQPPPAPTSVPPTNLPAATEAPTPVPDAAGQPPEAQVVSFTAGDGEELTGTFYPAAAAGAPVIVLMHWAPGYQEEWTEMAFWLQNRGLTGNTPNPKGYRIYDPSTFPAMLDGMSFNIFTFNFRDCSMEQDGCAGWHPDGWLLDSQAGMLKASQMEGVDATRVVAIGSSIGADGAMDGCAWLNQQGGEAHCPGAMALSPGDYLNLPFRETVAEFEAADPVVVGWCVYGVVDELSAYTCKGAAEDTYTQYRLVEYPGNGHGTSFFFVNEYTPDPMVMVLDFLKLALGL